MSEGTSSVPCRDRWKALLLTDWDCGCRLGRKPAFMMTTLIAGSFGMLAATSGNVWYLVTCRAVQGFGLGGNLAVDFSLFMEYVPTESRGRMTTFLTIFATIGSLIASGLAWALSDTAGATPNPKPLPTRLLPLSVLSSGLFVCAGWRVFLVLVSAPGLLIAAARSQMLESPHFLATSGRMDECYEVLSTVSFPTMLRLLSIPCNPNITCV